MKCYIQKPSEVQRKWHLIDAEGKTLGRLSTEIAKLLVNTRLLLHLTLTVATMLL